MNAALTHRAAIDPHDLLHSPLGTAGALALIALARNTLEADVPREVLVLRLSQLPPTQRRGHHRRLLEDLWEPLRQTSRTQLHDLPNGDVCAVEAPPAHHLHRVRDLLLGALDSAAAPLAAARVVRHLCLPTEAAALVHVVEHAMGLTSGIRPAPAPAQGPPLQADALIGAEKALAMADLSPMLHRLRVCRLDPGGGSPEPLWEERRIDHAAVCAAILPSHDLHQVPWLRRRLHGAIDRRVLAGHTRAEELRALRECSVPLTLDAVCSAEFQRFEALLPMALRGGLGVGIAAEEALVDPAGFRFARDYVQGRGHRLVLEVANAGTLRLLNLDSIGHDVLRLAWSESLPPLGSPDAQALAEALPSDPERMVLAETDRPAAIAWGWELGFRQFSGRLIEQRRLSA